jgi:hypothetical protein
VTVSDLIRELQAMPNQHAPVRLILSHVWVPDAMGGWDKRYLEIGPDRNDSLAVDDIRNEGAFVLIKSGLV